ncbi:MAG: SIR2 family protein [Chloroflexi bacterium]|nr:SIR2 family protein [Chloroflexota bacterium]
MTKQNEIDWRMIIRRIKDKKFTPIISDRVFFPGDNAVIPSWAREIGFPYPTNDGLSIAQLAQYLGINSRDYLTAKEDFLDFSKRYTLDWVKNDRQLEPGEFLDTLMGELSDLTYSQLATRLDFPKFVNPLDNPLQILAQLPLAIYVTTSYYDFLEAALRAAGKDPVTEICYWHDDLQDEVPSIFKTDKDFQPTPQRPLVYHLNGLDAYPASLVITEDDYLDFLVKVAEDLEAVPRRVTQALSDSTLLLLGYQLEDWNFKSLFRGLINTRSSSRRLLSLSIQMIPANMPAEQTEMRQKVQDYLGRYFDKANFDVYWGTPQEFTQELWAQWQGIT